MQLSIKERYDNLRINDLASRMAPKPNAISHEASYETELVAVAERKLAATGNKTEHDLLIRRARRQHTLVHQAVIRGDLEGVRRHLTDENVDLATINGLTPLHLAAFACGQVQRTARWDRIVRAGEKSIEEQILNYLLEAGAPVDVVDDMKRLPAACVYGSRIPPMLAHVMDAKRERTARIAPATPETNDKPTVYNAFYDESDTDRVGKRGGPGNTTGRGGNCRGITKIKGEFRHPLADDGEE